MPCLFCKADTSGSRSVEHIIPESLGNKRHVLPKGVVCDACNNYFSKAVEKPFLEAPGVRALRFHEELVSKKGRIPSIEGIISPRVPVSVTRDLKDGLSVLIPPDAVGRVLALKQGLLMLPTPGPWPEGSVLSRFLAKIALESMASRLIAEPDGLNYLCEETQLDAIRDHARRGRISDWPVHTRRIYPANGRVPSSDGTFEQVVHESDFLVTDASEWYFVLAIFGVEFAINLGGPDIDGYRRWLGENEGASVLYSPKNLQIQPMPIAPEEDASP